MRESSANHFVGLDIGTSTVRCVVGMVDPNGGSNLSIIGHGSAPNIGMRKGVVVHIEDTAEAITKALTEAERISGVHIERATVNINGTHVSGLDSKGVIAISAANSEITTEDRLRVEEAATVVNFPPNREIVQFFAKNYSLDGQRNIKNPVGMHGVRLEVDAHIVTATTVNVRSLDMALEKAGVRANHHTVSSLASAEAVLGRQQKEAGTLLLDIGSGTTNLIVIEDGEVQHIAVIGIGGMHITNDLAIGLRTDLDIAEKVKLEYAQLGEPKKTTAILTVGNAHHSFAMADIVMIAEARVDELFEYVDKELRKIRRFRKLPGGIVLTGGTAKLPGIASFAKDRLQLAARVGSLQTISGLVEAVEDVSYASAVGLMLLDMLLLPEQQQAGAGRQATDNAMGMVDAILRRLRRL
jgi:cell division protein FtsA